MHLLIPFLDTRTFDAAFAGMLRDAACGDRVTVIAPVIVPGALPVDVDAGMIWKRVCRAEVRLAHARQVAERVNPRGVRFAFIRVRARDSAAAIIAGAAHVRADCIVLTPASGIRGILAEYFGARRTVRRDAHCPVCITSAALPANDCRAGSAAPLGPLGLIAINREFATTRPGVADGAS